MTSRSCLPSTPSVTLGEGLPLGLPPHPPWGEGMDLAGPSPAGLLAGAHGSSNIYLALAVPPAWCLPSLSRAAPLGLGAGGQRGVVASPRSPAAGGVGIRLLSSVLTETSTPPVRAAGRTWCVYPSSFTGACFPTGPHPILALCRVLGTRDK